MIFVLFCAIISTPTSPPDRTATNKCLLSIETAHTDMKEANMDNRRLEQDRTRRNIQWWRKASYQTMSENARDMKCALRESSSEAKRQVEDEKKYRKYCLAEGSDALSRTLSQHSSSRVRYAILCLDMFFRVGAVLTKCRLLMGWTGGTPLGMGGVDSFLYHLRYKIE